MGDNSNIFFILKIIQSICKFVFNTAALYNYYLPVPIEGNGG